MERDHHRRPLQRQLAGHAGLGENLYLGRGATCAAVVARHRASLLATPEIISSKRQFTLP
jgi:hypothetical protein